MGARWHRYLHIVRIIQGRAIDGVHSERIRLFVRKKKFFYSVRTKEEKLARASLLLPILRSFLLLFYFPISIFLVWLYYTANF